MAEVRKRYEPLAGSARPGAGASCPPHPHFGMAARARCPPRPPGATDPTKRGKGGTPGGLCLRLLTGLARAVGLGARGAPASDPAERTCNSSGRAPAAPHRRAQGRTLSLAGCPSEVEPDALCARGTPSPPARPAQASRCPCWGFQRSASGAPYLLAPVEEALALGPYVEQRPHPLAQFLNCGFPRHVLNGARLRAVDGANLDPHLGAGRRGRLRFVSPCAPGAAPRPARAASPEALALSG